VPRKPDELQNHDVILDLNIANPDIWTFGSGGKRADVKVTG
jgi:hypothetical protein